MKRMIMLLMFITSLTVVSQEEVLLRLNYTEGDQYSIKTEQKQNSGLQGGMSMNMTMDMIVSEVSTDTIKTESKIASIAMNMMRGEMSMSYDSSMEEEDLDQMGLMLKSQFDPMMDAIILNTSDKFGNIIQTTIEPAIPALDRITSYSSTIYPEEKVSVGSSWTSENDNQGMKMSTTYTVTEIKDGMLYLDITGTISGQGSGSLKGTSEIELSSGLSKKRSIKMTIDGQDGINANINSNVTITKVE